jgi:hypothetical protein
MCNTPMTSGGGPAEGLGSFFPSKKVMCTVIPLSMGATSQLDSKLSSRFVIEESATYLPLCECHGWADLRSLVLPESKF